MLKKTFNLLRLLRSINIFVKYLLVAVLHDYRVFILLTRLKKSIAWLNLTDFCTGLSDLSLITYFFVALQSSKKLSKCCSRSFPLLHRRLYIIIHINILIWVNLRMSIRHMCALEFIWTMYYAVVDVIIVEDIKCIYLFARIILLTLTLNSKRCLCIHRARLRYHALVKVILTLIACDEGSSLWLIGIVCILKESGCLGSTHQFKAICRFWRQTRVLVPRLIEFDFKRLWISWVANL